MWRVGGVGEFGECGEFGESGSLGVDGGGFERFPCMNLVMF